MVAKIKQLILDNFFNFITNLLTILHLTLIAKVILTLG